MRGRVNAALVALLLLGWICILAKTAEVEDVQNDDDSAKMQARGGGGSSSSSSSSDDQNADDDQDEVAKYNEQRQRKGKKVGASLSSDATVMLERASTWLWNQRDKSAGWGNETARVLLALRLVNLSRDVDVPPTLNLDFQLSTKQLELEIVLLLWRHRDFESSPVRSAFYTLALNAMCMDPRQFHGHDLIGTIQHHEPLSDYEFAITSLAACSAQVHIRKRQMRRLLDIAHTAQDHNIETIVMDILTLRCIVQDHRHRNLQHFLQKPLISLVQRQSRDGSFGDLHTTALALQALEEIENELAGEWNKTATLGWLASNQRPDGSFEGDIKTTAEVVLSLVPRGIVSIRFLDCAQSFQDTLSPPKIILDGTLTKAEEVTSTTMATSSTTTAASSTATSGQTDVKSTSAYALPPRYSKNAPQPLINVSYTLWVGSDISKIYNLTLTAPKNETFYEVMVLAARRSPDFEFSAYDWPNGHYVHTLAGYKEEPMSYHYWLLFRLPSPPEPSSPPGNQFVAPGGVDDLKISTGEHYLFWYKKL